MKNTFFFLVFLVQSMPMFCQKDTITPRLEAALENWCPLYILDNYCSGRGLSNIKKALNVDDRVSGIQNSPSTSEPNQPPNTIVYYNDVILSFENWEKGHGDEYLHSFIIYFGTKREMELFAMCYAYLMGFTPDDESPGRYYYENSPMNAVTQNFDSKHGNYYAVCFVFQLGYCD